MFSATARKLLAIRRGRGCAPVVAGTGVPCGPFRQTARSLSPKQKSSSRGSTPADNSSSNNKNNTSNTTNKNKSSSSTSSTSLSSSKRASGGGGVGAALSSRTASVGPIAELHRAARLRERSPTTNRQRNAAAAADMMAGNKVTMGKGTGKALGSSSSSTSIGRPLVRRSATNSGGNSVDGEGGGGRRKRQSSGTLQPLKKLTDAEMDALESGVGDVGASAQRATAAARSHQRKALQKAALNLNSFLSSAGTPSSLLATATVVEREEIPTAAIDHSVIPMSSAHAVFLAQSRADLNLAGAAQPTAVKARGGALPLPPQINEEGGGFMYDDGTVEPSSTPMSSRGGGRAFDFSHINEMNRSAQGKGRGGNSTNAAAGNRGASSPPSSTAGNPLLIIDDGSSSGDALGASQLVFSPLNNRLLHRDTPVVQSLLHIGFAINEHSKELYLKHPDVLNEYAHAVRYGGIELPKCWKAKMANELGYLLQNARVEDPATHVQRLIESKKSTRRANVGMIASISGQSSGDGSSSSAAERAAQEESSTQNIVLNKEQREVLEYALRGYCMYIGGSAGTGKTVLLTALKRRLTQEGLRVAMTATTGIAGCHIGGATFHHTFSVTATDEFSNKKNLLSYDVVVIDEVSMMSRKLFEEFDDALRHEAGINIPFGGVQVILCGDFLQLSPVNEESVIHSPLFKDNFVLTKLVQQVRQSQFPEFAQMLGEIRHGTCPPLLQQAIKSLPPGTMASDAINLLPTNVQVRDANQKELERIEGPAFKLTPRVSEVKLDGEFTPTILLHVGPNFNATKLLMMAYDFIRERVQLRNPRGFSLYRLFSDGYAFRIALPQAESALWKRTLVSRFLEIAPLVEGWSVDCTVHNIVNDGNGLHTAEYEESLSRLLTNHPVVQTQELKEGCRVLLRSNLTTTLVNGSVGVVKGFCPCEKEYVHSYLRADESVDSLIEEYNNFHKVELGYPATLPLVQFAEGMPPIAIPPQSITIGGTAATQYYALEGIAVPLTLAYAFTVHKVQGLTLVGRVHLELSKMWPCNHLLYVAMSRVRNPDQLSLSGFDPSMVVADPSAVTFDEELVAKEGIEVPETATVAVWKGFDTYSVNQDFYKKIGGGSDGSSSSSVVLGAKGAAALTSDSDRTKKAKPDRKILSASAVRLLKLEAENAKLVEMANNGQIASSSPSSQKEKGTATSSAAPLVDETVFMPGAGDSSSPPPPNGSASSDGVEGSVAEKEDAFAQKSKPASHHELLFQQMAQRGAGSYKFFTESSSTRYSSSSTVPLTEQKKRMLELAKSQYISALGNHTTAVSTGKKGSAGDPATNNTSPSSTSSDYDDYTHGQGPDGDAPPM